MARNGPTGNGDSAPGGVAGDQKGDSISAAPPARGGVGRVGEPKTAPAAEPAASAAAPKAATKLDAEALVAAAAPAAILAGVLCGAAAPRALMLPLPPPPP